MTKCECNLVRKRLEAYQWHQKRIAQEYAWIRELEERYQAAATPGCVPIEKPEGSGGSRKSRESLYLDIFDQQREAKIRALASEAEAVRIEAFIKSIDSDQRDLLELAYLQGKRYGEIAEAKGYTESGVRKAIARCLRSVPRQQAMTSGLL